MDWDLEITNVYMKMILEIQPSKIEGVRREVDGVCCILESGPWGPAIEYSLYGFNEKPLPGLINLIAWLERAVGEMSVARNQVMKSLSIRLLEEGPVNAVMSLLDEMKSNSLQCLASKFFYVTGRRLLTYIALY
ncbi:hypothetical protein PVK06_035666 [Gossypium arboreum]|uniref:Uncharacterized protein n=1 Tax=Gossypium arboreum TaxID=29729 RepID=A0ABR0NHU7_GOSAR|nr:hypothetical protein PVK06_035666 [Gossypium arboreum]